MAKITPILIPSRSRWNVKHRTTALMPLSIAETRAMVFAPEEQLEDYRSSWEECAYIGSVSDLAHSIGEKRYAMALWAKAKGFKRFWMMDDDLAFFRRESANSTKLRKLRDEEWSEMLQTAEDFMNAGDYAAVGVDMRQGNNNRELPGDVNTRCIRAVLFNTEDFLSVDHCRVPYMEDFDILLQLLRRGRPNFVMSEFCQNQADTQQPGGCSDHRNVESHNRSAQLLQRLHPKFVSIVEKEYKAGGELSNRLEVRVMWKKAFASATTR